MGLTQIPEACLSLHPTLSHHMGRLVLLGPHVQQIPGDKNTPRGWKAPSQVNSIQSGSVNNFPHSSVSKESACSAGNLGSIPGSGRSPGEENGNSLQYSCLENPMDRGAW